MFSYNDWVLLDFDNMLGAPLNTSVDPSNFFSCGYQLATISADIEIIKEEFRHRRKAAIVNEWNPHSFIDLHFYDAIFVIDPEVTWGSIDTQLEKLRTRFNNKNVFLITSGANPAHNDVLIFPWWLPNTSYLNISSNTDSNYLPKNKIFDVLLGHRRSHRDFIYEKLLEKNLETDCLISYLSQEWNQFSNKNSYLYRSPELDILESVNAHVSIQKNGYFRSGEHCFHSYIGVSREVPWRIYDNSYYSIVAETLGDSHILFFTEKTAKPLLAGRLFVLFGPANQLGALRNYGFKTFDNVIDETYDTILDSRERHSAAFDQVVKLSKCDHRLVHEQTLDARIHNANLIRNTEHFLTPVKQWIFEKLQTL